MEVVNLSERQAEAEERLAELRRKRGAAILDGKKIDAGEMTALEAEIVSLSDAQAEKVRRDRKAAQATWEREQDALREQYAALQATYLSKWREAEVALATYAEAAAWILRTGGTMRSVGHVIEGFPVPIQLAENEICSRIGGRMSALMANVPGHRGRLGGVEWNGGSLYTPQRPWQQDEERVIGAAAPIMENTTHG